MTPTTLVTAGDERCSAKKFWPHDLVLGLLPLLLGFQLLVAITFLPTALRGLADFRQLYAGGYMIRMDHAAELYNYDAQLRFEEIVAPVGAQFSLPINHLAFEELLFVPFSLLNYRKAYWAFMALNVSLLIACVRLLRHRFKILSDRWRWLPVLLIAAFSPISRALLLGQDSVILLALLAGALWALDHENEFVSGFLVGIGIFKFQIVIPIALLFLMWRRWRFFAGFSSSSIAAAIVSLWLVGFSGLTEYVRMLMSMSLHLTSEADVLRYGTDPRNMVNLRALLSAILEGSLSHVYVQLFVGACSVAVLATAATSRPSLPLAITAASLMSYHFFVHDASILIITIAALLCSGSVWNGVVATLLLIAPWCTIVPGYGYLASIPLLAVFISMLAHAKRSPSLGFSVRA